MADLSALTGGAPAHGEWHTIDQAMIDAFAEATGDRQWIHVDTERAAREMPGGRTIAHGYLLLSLLPTLAPPMASPPGTVRRINYGMNRIRFVSSVPAGACVRVMQTILSAEPAKNGTLFTLQSVMEIQGEQRPAFSAETLILLVSAEPPDL